MEIISIFSDRQTAVIVNYKHAIMGGRWFIVQNRNECFFGSKWGQQRQLLKNITLAGLQFRRQKLVRHQDVNRMSISHFPDMRLATNILRLKRMFVLVAMNWLDFSREICFRDVSHKKTSSLLLTGRIMYILHNIARVLVHCQCLNFTYVRPTQPNQWTVQQKNCTTLFIK